MGLLCFLLGCKVGLSRLVLGCELGMPSVVLGCELGVQGLVLGCQLGVSSLVLDRKVGLSVLAVGLLSLLHGRRRRAVVPLNRWGGAHERVCERLWLAPVVGARPRLERQLHER